MADPLTGEVSVDMRPRVVSYARAAYFMSAAALLGIWIAGLVTWMPDFVSGGKVGTDWNADFVFYRHVAERWLATGELYLPQQLAGPWDLVIMESVLYPPTALFLFVPFVFAPAILWWAIPLGVLAYAVHRWRPARWSWLLLAVLVLWPRSIGSLLAGNTDMWIAAAVAGGLLWGWPAALVTIKPTFALLALVGVRRRSWWVAMAAGVALLIPMLPLWADYLRVMSQLREIDIMYANATLPLIVAPLVAWWARRQPIDGGVAPGLAAG